MSYLQELKLVVSQRSIQVSPIQYRRNKLIKKLDEQLKCAQARTEGRDHIVTILRSARSNETHTRQHVQVPYRIRPWWHADSEGHMVLELRYGSKRIELAKGKTGIEVDNLPQLIQTFENLKLAVAAGELDSCLESTANSIRSNLRK